MNTNAPTVAPPSVAVHASLSDASTHGAAEPWLAQLVVAGELSNEAITRAQTLAQSTRTPLGAVLTRLGLVSELALASALAKVESLPLLRLPDLHVDSHLPAGLNREFCMGKRALPVRWGPSRQLFLAMADPTNAAVREGIAFAYGAELQPVVALDSEIDEAWRALPAHAPEQTLPDALTNNADLLDDTASLADHASDAPVIRWVNRLLAKAMALKASDIHFEPAADALHVRFRVDGELGATETLARHWADPVVSRLKLMAKLDIAEKRLPQDGRIKAAVQGRAVDLRVATFPILNGESVVLRVLGQQHVDLALAKVGLPEAGLLALRHALAQPNGLVLITGPTGSGKTTTLYAALHALKRPELKLVTVEDPIEYTLPGVAQLQVKPEIGLDYAAALRSVLRNDPDVIMVGEIRDKETADIAIRASLTGHLVLATLHTNSAAGAVTRLLDLGVQDFLLSATLTLTSAQRLLRCLCNQCKQWRPANVDEVLVLRQAGLLASDADPPLLAHAVGCPGCLGRGYLGRAPVFEAIAMSPAVRQTVHAGFDEAAFTAAAAGGAGTLLSHGLARALAGETTVAEVLVVVGGAQWRDTP